MHESNLNSSSGKKLLVTGGGTAGHVYPALAVLEALQPTQHHIDVLWIGQKAGIEQKLVQKAGIRYLGISAGKLRRYFSVQNFLDIFKVAWGCVQAWHILRKERPNLVFSKGGFVTVPVVVAAHWLKIPVMIHESDSDSGLANRIASRFADKIFVPYPETISSFNETVQSRVVVSGNPVRQQFYEHNAERAKQKYGIGADEQCILVLGGSLGSQQVNILVQELLPYLPSHVKVIHQMGEQWFSAKSTPQYMPIAYIDEGMHDLIAASTLVISRAGAGAIWEFATVGAVPIFIPLGQRGDQIRNAALLQKRGACISLAGKDATLENLKTAVLDLLQNEKKRIAMSTAIKAIPTQNASKFIAEHLIQQLNQEKKK